MLPIEKQEAPETLKLKEKLGNLEEEIRKIELQKEEIIKSGQLKADELIKEAKAKIAAENEQIVQKREEEQKIFEENLAQEAEKVKAAAYKEGYDDGYKQGYVVTVNELENKIHAVDNFAKSQFELKNNIIKSSELDIISLVIEIARKVCTKSLELNPEIIKILTSNAIKELKDKENITIIINPKLMEVINSISDRLKDDIPQLQSIKILEDNNISPDGTIVESLLSRVDCRVKSQINEIADKLFETYNSEDEEFENFMMSLSEPDITSFENIEISDDANIESFLDELEEIPSYGDTIRDEDAQYYRNLDLEELKKAEVEQNINNAVENEEIQKTETNINIDEINWDELEGEVFEENNENSDIHDIGDIAESIDLSVKGINDTVSEEILPETLINDTEKENEEEIDNLPDKKDIMGDENV